MPPFEEGLTLLNTLVTTDSSIVVHFAETTRVITALTKVLNTDPEVTSLLIRGRELFPFDLSDLPRDIISFSNFMGDVDLVFLPGDCGGADHIKHYYVVGDLKSG
jgi:hypothetical protein